MTLARRNASPVASGIDGAGSLPGVQAGSPRTSPSKVGASDFDCASADSAAQHDNSGSGAPGRVRRLLAPRASLLAGLGCNSPAQSPICPELTAYITTLLSVIGAVAWAHVFAMNTTLANQLINFHPKEVICDAVGNKPEFLCAVSHKEGE